MGGKNITKKGLVISRQFEIFVEKELRKNEKRN